MMSDEQREAVVEEAKTWLRTPYQHLQRVKGAGVDCATILAEVYGKVLGIDVPVDFYPPDWHLHKGCGERYLDNIKKYCTEVFEPMRGDIVVVHYGQAYSHGAIIVTWPTVIHAYMQARCVTYEDLLANQEIAVRKRLFFSPNVR